MLELNKHVKATAAVGSNNTITVTIGSGQPLVVGNRAYQLAAVPTPNDPSRTAVAYVTRRPQHGAGRFVALRRRTGRLARFPQLDPGRRPECPGPRRHHPGRQFQCPAGAGPDRHRPAGRRVVRRCAAPLVLGNRNSQADPVAPTTVGVTISDATKLTTSDYSVDYDAANSRFTVTRLSDKQKTNMPAYTQPGPQTMTVDGLDFTVSGKQMNGDSFTVRPTANGAARFQAAHPRRRRHRRRRPGDRRRRPSATRARPRSATPASTPAFLAGQPPSRRRR